MQFIKYPSLTNHYAILNKKYINLENEYIATEKIHGANITIAIDKDKNIDIAKRTAYLTPKEKTHAPWNTVAEFVKKEKSLILTWFDQINKYASKKATVLQVNLYGELYGDQVQEAMPYFDTLNKTREIRFFDIHVLLDNNTRLILSQNQLTDILGIDFVVPVLRTGKLKDLLLTIEEMQSNFGECKAEGQVYKPKNEYILEQNKLGQVEYPVVKHKYDEWLETQNIASNFDMNYAANEIQLTSAVASRITKQRLLNILSHGELEATEQNTGKFVTAMVEDIKDEISREEPGLIINDKVLNKHKKEMVLLYKEFLSEK